MKVYKSRTWQYETMGAEDGVVLFDINPFKYKWQPTGKRGKIENTSGQTCTYAVNQITVDGKNYEFIAIEISNGVWEFYTFKF